MSISENSEGYLIDALFLLEIAFDDNYLSRVDASCYDVVNHAHQLVQYVRGVEMLGDNADRIGVDAACEFIAKVKAMCAIEDAKMERGL